MKNVIRLHTYRRETISITDWDRWIYTRKNWFTDQMWKLLHKLGCLSNPVDDTYKYKMVEVDTESVGKAILKCLDGMHMMYMKPTRVYMGQDEFDRHVYSKDYDRYAQIDFTVEMGYNQKIYGIPVSVIPHMSGILIV